MARDATMQALLRARRRAAGLADDLPVWGLALSGGGIRSATFALGLLTALAKGGTLSRIDLLSTVSGGGYAGAFLGRLYTRLNAAADAPQVEQAVAEPGGLAFEQWLRANGRYLLPGGLGDRTQAAALFLRNLVAVHLELGLLALLLGTVMVAVNLLLWLGVASLGLAGHDWVYTLMALLPRWMPTLVWALLPWLTVLGLVYAMRYWTLSWMQRPRNVGGIARGSRRAAALFAAGSLLAAAVLWVGRDALILPGHPRSAQLRETLLGVGITLLTSAALAALLNVWSFWPRPWRGIKTLEQIRQRVEAARTSLTQRLGLCLQLGLVVVALGVLDKLAWAFAFESINPTRQGVTLGVVAVVARAVLPMASSLVPKPRLKRLMSPLVRAAGYALTFVLAAWWMSLVYRVTMGALWGRDALDASAAFFLLGAMALGCGGYLLLTACNADFLNASSLHRFYRARLSRSYLGASNAERLGMPPMEQAKALDGALEVKDVAPHDDVRLGAYRPHLKGGPIHLINVCANETRNPAGGLYNQDRQGRLLTVAGGGWAALAGQPWRKLKPRHADSLATWVAVSGAAVAPAMGSITRGGLSALLAFAGLRLGYWWNSPLVRKPRCTLRALLRDTKTGLLLRETFGLNLALDEPRWLLTDGGHFENTAAYALLLARCPLIIVADCGADPQYRFGDLENLVRKARIDLGMEIMPLRPRAARLGDDAGDRPRPPALAHFGSLDDLASPHSSASLAAAHIDYGDGTPGLMVLVKPSLVANMPVDLANFAAANPAFPQQTTADQFFGEAQWESYHRLGEVLGTPLSAAFLAALAQHEADWFEPDHSSAAAAVRQSKNAEANAASPAASRLPARLSAAAVGAGALGVGALLTMAVTAWQAWDTARSGDSAITKLRTTALEDLAAQWSRTMANPMAPPDPEKLGTLAARVMHHAEVLCPGEPVGWYQESATARRVARETAAACERMAPLQRPSPCSQLLDLTAARPVDWPLRDEPVPNCLATLTHLPCPTPLYGLYDYDDAAAPQDAPPGSPEAMRRADALLTIDSTFAPTLPFAPGCVRPLHPLRMR